MGEKERKGERKKETNTEKEERERDGIGEADVIRARSDLPASSLESGVRCFMGIDVLDFSKAIVLIGSLGAPPLVLINFFSPPDPRSIAVDASIVRQRWI